MNNTTLYISYDGMSDPLGQSQVIPYLKGLSHKGYKIILISFEKRLESPMIKLIKNDLQDAGIVWKPLKYHKKPALPATLLDLFIGTVFTFLYCKKFKIKLIHCRGHYLTSLMAYLLRPFHKFKYIFDMRGFWADERIEGDIWTIEKRQHHLQYRFFKKLESIFLAKADQVITLTFVAKDYISTNFNLKKEIIVIPCCTDLTLFKNANTIQDPELNNLKKSGKLILIYLGSVGTWYMLKEMLQFYKLLNKNRSSVFLFVTTESKDLIYKEASLQEIAENNIIIRKAARTEVPAYLSIADAGIFFIKPVFSKKGSSPTKHAEMLACELPLVTNSGIGDLDEIIKSTKTGIVINGFEQESMEQGAHELLQLIAEKDRSHYRITAEKYYSLNLAIQQYSKIYSSLLYE